MTDPAFSSLVLCETGATPHAHLESYSPFCLKAHRALRFAGFTYARRHGHPGSFRGYNPTGQVPVLLVDSKPIADSTAILEWIDRHAPGALVPADARDRAEAWLWEELGDTALNGFLVAARWADDRNWPAVRAAYFGAMPAVIRAVVPGRIRARVVAGLSARDVTRAGVEACWQRFTRTLDQLETRAPKDGFWLGNALSVADLGLFAQLHSLRTDLTPWQRDRVAERPALSAWLNRVDVETSARSEIARAA